MLNFSVFLVRSSGRYPGSFYIDCGGLYHIDEIAKGAGLEAERLHKLYEANGGKLNSEQDVYYFSDAGNAKKAISGIFAAMQNSNKGKYVFFSEEEIQYLRKSVINDAMGFAGNDSRMVDAILRKLNG